MKSNRLLWSILLFALALRLPLLNGSFWLDEAAQAIESIRPLSQQLDIIADFQPPLMHYLVHFAAQLSTSEWWLRLWGALIPGLITIWLTYLLAKKLLNQQAAIISSLLLATSSLHIFYSQELRPYSLPAMWGMLSTWLIFNKKTNWRQFALVSSLGLYSSYLYPFLLIPQLWLLWRRGEKQLLLKSAAVTAALYAIWLPTFNQQLTAGQQLRLAIPGWETVVSLPQAKVLILVPLKFVYGLLNIEPNLFFILTSLALLAAVFLGWRPIITKKFWQWQNNLTKILFLFISPLMLSWLVSFMVPVVRPKRLLYLLPLMYLLAVAPLTNKKIKRSLAILPAIILLAINVYSTGKYWADPALQREDWRGLKQEITTILPAEDTIAIFVFDEAFAPWRWYQPATITNLAISQETLNDELALKETLKVINNFQYVLIFDYLRDLTDPDNLLEPAVVNFGLTGRGLLAYPNLGFVRIYTQPDNALGFNL